MEAIASPPWLDAGLLQPAKSRVKKGIKAKRGKNLLNTDNFKTFSSAAWECLEIIRALGYALERYLTGARIGIIAYNP
jgi:hypothetical protein